MKFLERPGLFKARPIDWSVQHLPSGDPIIRVNFECCEVYENDAFRPMRETRVVKGDFFVLKKTGAPNEAVMQSLCCVLGWGGSFQEVARNPHPPQTGLVQVDVEAREYKGKTYCQVKWLNEENSKPRGGAIGDDEVAELDRKYGADLAKAAKKLVASKPAKSEDVDTSSIPF